MSEADTVRALLIPFVLFGSVLIWKAGRAVAGRLLVLIGSMHLVGGWVGRDALRRIVRNGIVGQADSGVGLVVGSSNQELVFWFLLWGFLMIVIGQLVIRMDECGIRVPRRVGVQLFVVNVICAVLIPKAGFWWVLLPSWLIARQPSDRSSVTSSSRSPSGA
jgi:hypothetical protein